MDESLVNRSIHCPYCGEAVDVVLDLSAGGQTYIEDCGVCCQPMQLTFETGDGGLTTLRVDRAG